MKLIINLLDSGIKNKTSKGIADEISALESCFALFLKGNRHFMGAKVVTITMTLCGKFKIRSLNRQYRQKDYATDVLSFPVYQNLRPDKKSSEKTFSEVELGDLIICKEIARSQSSEFNISYEEEIVHLAVHGFLHLLGFDHELSSKEERTMEKNERELVDKIYKKLKKLKNRR